MSSLTSVQPARVVVFDPSRLWTDCIAHDVRRMFPYDLEGRVPGSMKESLEVGFVSFADTSAYLGDRGTSQDPHRTYLHLFVIDAGLFSGKDKRERFQEALDAWVRQVAGGPDAPFMVLVVHSYLLLGDAAQDAAASQASLFSRMRNHLPGDEAKRKTASAKERIDKLKMHAEKAYPRCVCSFVPAHAADATAAPTALASAAQVAEIICNRVCVEHQVKEKQLCARLDELKRRRAEASFSIGDFWMTSERYALNFMRFGMYEAALAAFSSSVTLGHRMLPGAIHSRQATLRVHKRTSSATARAAAGPDWEDPTRDFDVISFIATHGTAIFPDASQLGFARGDDFKSRCSFESFIYVVGCELVLLLLLGNRKGAFQVFTAANASAHGILTLAGVPAVEVWCLLYHLAQSMRVVISAVCPMREWMSIDPWAFDDAAEHTHGADAGSVVSTAVSRSPATSATAMRTSVAPSVADVAEAASVEYREALRRIQDVDHGEMLVFARDLFVRLATVCGYHLPLLSIMTRSLRSLERTTAAPADDTRRDRVVTHMPSLANIDVVNDHFLDLTRQAADLFGAGGRLRYQCMLYVQAAEAIVASRPDEAASVLRTRVTPHLQAHGTWPALHVHVRGLMVRCLANLKQAQRTDTVEPAAYANACLQLVALSPDHETKRRYWQEMVDELTRNAHCTAAPLTWTAVFGAVRVAAQLPPAFVALAGEDEEPRYTFGRVPVIDARHPVELTIAFDSAIEIDPARVRVRCDLVGRIQWDAAPRAAAESFTISEELHGGGDGAQSPIVLQSMSGVSTGFGNAATSITLSGAAVRCTPSSARTVYHRNDARHAAWEVTATFVFAPPEPGTYKLQRVELEDGPVRIVQCLDAGALGFETDTDDDARSNAADAGETAREVPAPIVVVVPDPSASTVAVTAVAPPDLVFFADTSVVPHPTIELVVELRSGNALAPRLAAWVNAHCCEQRRHGTAAASFRPTAGSPRRTAGASPDFGDAVSSSAESFDDALPLGHVVMCGGPSAPPFAAVAHFMDRQRSGDLAAPRMARSLSTLPQPDGRRSSTVGGRRSSTVGGSCDVLVPMAPPESSAGELLRLAPSGPGGPALTVNPIVASAATTRIGRLTQLNHAKRALDDEPLRHDSSGTLRSPTQSSLVLDQSSTTLVGSVVAERCPVYGTADRPALLLAPEDATASALRAAIRGDTTHDVLVAPSDPDDGIDQSATFATHPSLSAPTNHTRVVSLKLPLQPQFFAALSLAPDGAATSPEVEAEQSGTAISVYFACDGQQGYQHGFTSLCVSLSRVFDVQFIIEVVQDTVHCFVQVENILSSVALWLTQPRLEFEGDVYYHVARTSACNAFAVQRPLQPGDTAVFGFDLEDVAVTAEPSDASRQSLRFCVDFAPAPRVDADASSASPPAPYRGPTNCYSSQLHSFVCSHARPFAASLRPVREAVLHGPQPMFVPLTLALRVSVHKRAADTTLIGARVWLSIVADQRCWEMVGRERHVVRFTKPGEEIPFDVVVLPVQRGALPIPRVVLHRADMATLPSEVELGRGYGHRSDAAVVELPPESEVLVDVAYFRSHIDVQ